MKNTYPRDRSRGQFASIQALWDQAVKKVLAVATAISQLAVIGIAGPGDPLANPERTFATFFGITSRRGPTHEELRALRNACAQTLPGPEA